MRESVYSRGNHRARHQQEDDDPIQNSSLSSRLQGRRRTSKFLILCLVLCFLTWIISRTLRSPLPVSTDRPVVYQAATRGIVFEMFRHYRTPQVRNRTFPAANPVHRRRRRRSSLLLDEDGSDSPGTHLSESAPQETCDEDQPEEQPFDEQGVVEVSPPLKFDQSLKNRMDVQNPEKEHCDPMVEDSATDQALAQWPLHGGIRETDLDIQVFYVKVPIGYGTDLKEYYMHIDTGSGLTWVMCKGRGPITAVGPNGLFWPKRDSFLDCRNKELCLKFQEDPMPCHKGNKFKCVFDLEYGDGMDVKGAIIVGDVSFEVNDGSQSHVHIAFGCADKVNDDSTMEDGQTQLADGLIGLGPHEGSWLRQLNLLGFIPDYVLAICFEPRLPGKSRPRPGPPVSESAGFVALGNSYTSQTASTVWTANIPVVSEDGELESDMYTARVVAMKYRTQIIQLQGPKRKREANQGVQMGFDSGSDLTYFTQHAYNQFVQVLDDEAKSRGYVRAKDSNEFVKNERRRCWSNKGQRIPLTEFGDLVLSFAPIAKDDPTSDLVIKPQYYITSGGSKKHPRTCFNILKESDFDYGNIGAEVMKGHLFIFNNDLNQIGWRAVETCQDLR